MKSLLTILFSIMILLANAQENSFTIQGKIELEKGNILVLSRINNKIDTIARGAISNHAFTINGNVSEAMVAHLVIEGYTGGYVMMLEPGNKYTATLTREGNGNIRGGKLQTAFHNYQKIVEAANMQTRELREKMNEAAEQKHFKTVNDLQKKVNKIQTSAMDKMRSVVDKNSDNVLAAYLLTSGSEKIEDLNILKQIYASLSEKAKQTEPGKTLAAKIAGMEQVGVNAVAPDFTLTTVEGKEVSLYSVKGKIKIIDFWASWCGPCRMENPNMVKLYNDFHDKGLEIISVSLDERKMPWAQAIKRDKMPWTHVSSLKGWKCDVVKKYDVHAVPTIFVLDENNRIIAKNIRAEKLRTFVSERLH